MFGTGEPTPVLIVTPDEIKFFTGEAEIDLTHADIHVDHDGIRIDAPGIHVKITPRLAVGVDKYGYGH